MPDMSYARLYRSTNGKTNWAEVKCEGLPSMLDCSIRLLKYWATRSFTWGSNKRVTRSGRVEHTRWRKLSVSEACERGCIMAFDKHLPASDGSVFRIVLEVN